MTAKIEDWYRRGIEEFETHLKKLTQEFNAATKAMKPFIHKRIVKAQEDYEKFKKGMKNNGLT